MVRCKLRGPMPLEFALRPRFKLERATPERKRRVRLSPLALPMLAYWLAIAGVTRTLIRAASDETTDGNVTSTATRDTAASDTAASDTAESDAVVPNLPATNPPAAPGSIFSAPPEPAFEPPPMLRATFDNAGDDERPLEPSTKAATLPPPRAPLSLPAEALALARQEEPRAPQLPPTATLFTAPTPRPRERDDAFVEQEPERAREPARAREPERDDGRAASLPSCESAAATANQDIDLRAGPGAPDLTRDAFAPVLENGSYLSHCAIPARTALAICVAVQDGKAVGVSVTTEPQSAAINACVRRSVAGLRFPRSARLDVTHTRFEASH